MIRNAASTAPFDSCFAVTPLAPSHDCGVASCAFLLASDLNEAGIFHD